MSVVCEDEDSVVIGDLERIADAAEGRASMKERFDYDTKSNGLAGKEKMNCSGGAERFQYHICRLFYVRPRSSLHVMSSYQRL